MAFTYGFYNSIDHDRVYNAEQVGSIFDGIIKDGVYMAIGDHMNVTVNTSIPMTVNIGTGRAWFDHTWSYNDALYPLTFDSSELLTNRIDAVVLEVNYDLSYRCNTFKIVKGTPATNPARPALTNTTTVHQYALAYVYIGKGVTNITQANITNNIGTTGCPFVTGVIQTMNIDTLVAQWQAQFLEWMTANDITHTNWWTSVTTTFDVWKDSQETAFEEWAADQEEAVETWTNNQETAFAEWYSHFVDELSSDQALHLQRQIDEIKMTTQLTLNVSDWTASGNEWVCTKTVAGMTDDGEPDVWVIKDSGASAASIDTNWGYIYKGITGTNHIMFYATTKPTINLTVNVKGVY